MNTTPHKPESFDLEWEAFRYVAGEMSVAEIEQFEQLLQDDLAACEAVANVTELSLSARTVLEDQSSPLIQTLAGKPSQTGRWVATIAALAALSLLIAILSIPNPSDSDHVANVPVADREREQFQSEQILSHWMTPVSNSADSSVEDLEPLTEETLLVSFDSEGEAAQIPDWMFDAVLLEPRESGPKIMDESGSPVQEF